MSDLRDRFEKHVGEYQAAVALLKSLTDQYEVCLAAEMIKGAVETELADPYYRHRDSLFALSLTQRVEEISTIARDTKKPSPTEALHAWDELIDLDKQVARLRENRGGK